MEGWQQIGIGLGAALLSFLLVIVIILTIRLSKTRAQNKKASLRRNGTILNLGKTPFPLRRSDLAQTPVSLNLSLPTEYDRKYPRGVLKGSSAWSPYHKLGLTRGSVESLYSSTEILTTNSADSEPELSSLPGHWQRTNSKSNLSIPDCIQQNSRTQEVNIQTIDISNSEQTGPTSQEAMIEFNLLYSPETANLIVHVGRVINLPLKYRKSCSSYVKVCLHGRRKSKVQTNVVHKSLHPDYSEWFNFPGYSLQELQQYTLHFTVRVKRFGKNKFIGDLFYPLSKQQITAGETIACKEPIMTPVAKPSQVKQSSFDLGQLFVLLQYQASAGRMKVLIRKANNLPKPTRSIGQPDHYVVINLVKGKEAQTFSETKAMVGCSPVWNQPFLFDMPCIEVDQYWLQFVVMRGRIYSKDGVIGYVSIGPATTSTGIAHWQESMNPRPQEIAKWHNIMPF